MPNLTDDLVVKVLCHPAASKVFVGDRNLEVENLALRLKCSIRVSKGLHPCFPCHVVSIRSLDLASIIRVVDRVRALNRDVSNEQDCLMLFSVDACQVMFHKFRGLSKDHDVLLSCMRRRHLIRGLPERWIIVGCGDYASIGNCAEALIMESACFLNMYFDVDYSTFTPERRNRRSLRLLSCNFGHADTTQTKNNVGIKRNDEKTRSNITNAAKGNNYKPKLKKGPRSFSNNNYKLNKNYKSKAKKDPSSTLKALKGHKQGIKEIQKVGNGEQSHSSQNTVPLKTTDPCPESSSDGAIPLIRSSDRLSNANFSGFVKREDVIKSSSPKLPRKPKVRMVIDGSKEYNKENKNENHEIFAGLPRLIPISEFKEMNE